MLAITALVTLALVAGMQLAPTSAVAAPEAMGAAQPVAAGSTSTVTSDPLPTVQIDGIVYAQAVAGNRVYAGGVFSNARPAGAAPGTQQTPRTNLLAYDLTTGELDTSFAPQLNGRVLAAAVSPDGSTLYIGGGFTSVNGQNRYRLAAFDTATGTLLPAWRAGTNSTVFGLAASDSGVYVAGQFTNVNNTTRTGVAAVHPTTGALLPFNPVHTGGYLARAIVVSPDGAKVVAAGSFLTTNGSDNPGRGMAALDATTGASLPWAVNSVLRNAGRNSAIYSLASDATSVYGSGYDSGGSKTLDDFEGAFRANWSDGAMVWMQDCHGDTYAVAPHNGILYTAAHTHYCGNIGEFPEVVPVHVNHSLAFGAEPSGRPITPDVHGYRSFTGQPAGALQHWYPAWGTGSASGIAMAGWSVASAGDYVLYGGEFTSINGIRQQGLVRFATPEVAPNKSGPVHLGGTWPITTSSVIEGQARIRATANHDADSATLTYELFRRGVAEPLATQQVASTYWVRPDVRFTDDTVTAGQTYDYRIRVTDPDGNTTQSDWSSVTIAAAGTGSAYDRAVLADEPAHFWPLGESNGTEGTDWAGAANLTVTGATRTTSGQAVGTNRGATTFAGNSGSVANSSVGELGRNTLSIEAWFRTTSTRGGKIVGFGSSATGTSAVYDRHLYLTGNGAITFGTFPGTVRVVQSGAGFNDGAWHHVVGTLGPDGMELFVDGTRVDSRADTTSGQSYTGYWRIGGDNVGGWPNISNGYLAGTIADVAIYGRQLTRTEIDEHRVASGRPSVLPAAPADAYGAAVYELDPTLYWRLGDSTAGVAHDSSADPRPGAFVRAGTQPFALGRTGALTGVANTAVGFVSAKDAQGTWAERQIISSARSLQSPARFAAETWFQTTSTGGGALFGFGNSSGAQTNASTVADRQIAMTPSGTLQFSVENGGRQVLETTTTYNDGAWHHVVGQVTDAGMELYVDGRLVASNAVKTGTPYLGYWRLGGDTTQAGDPFWVGTLDEAAVYPRPLTADQVRAHFELGATGVVNTAPEAVFTAEATGLDVVFDASASADAEGAIAGYDWDFGDETNEQGTQPTTSHTFNASGTYTVSLTVTDASGVSTTTAQDVTVLAPNVEPTAAFDATADGLVLSVDAAASTDTDGAVASYAWDFGDGTTGTGVTATHEYAQPGEYTVQLTVTDDRGAVVTTSRAVEIAMPNVVPTAAFTASTDGLTVQFDATTSADADGTIAEYTWDFGDGTTGTGATASHAYSVQGEHQVTLTVTDDAGATAVSTQTVTVSSVVPAGAVAYDSFSRAQTNEWGTPDLGSPWVTRFGNAAFSVADGEGVIGLAPTQTRQVTMNDVVGEDNTVAVQFSSDQLSTGGTMNVDVIARQVGASTYSARVRLEPNGLMRLYLLRDQTVLPGGNVLLPQRYAAGSDVQVRVQAVGTSPTTLRASVWLDGTAEPASWVATATDTTAALQAPGSVGLKLALSSVSTLPTQVLRFDEWTVTQG